ncbi:unnamed protein product [Ectocarpus sp. 13 AM-2016]
MVLASQLSGLPLEVLQGCILVPFGTPRDVAHLLAASRGLRSLRRGYVSGVLDLLFQGKPGAGNAITWIRSHHGGKDKGKDKDKDNKLKGNDGSLEDVSLVDWLCGLRDMSATGAYRASLGETHSLLITPGGRALSAGSGRHGVLGASSRMNRFLFTEVDLGWGRFPERIPVAAVACGQRHTLILTAVGTVHSCGLGDYGRLGHGNEASLSRPTLIESLAGERITQVAAGEAHSVAVSWSGKAFTWGWGYLGILGRGSDADVLKPTRVAIPFINMVGGSNDGGDARGGGVDAVEGHVTCATAGRSCTVLGTRHGAVLFSGFITTTTGNRFCAAFSEFGRLGNGLRCWRVQCECLPVTDTTLVMAIDPAGQVYEVQPRNGVAFGGNRSSRYGNPSEQRVSLSADCAPCSSVILSPSDDERGRCWLETGGEVEESGWGMNVSCGMVGVSRDGRLLFDRDEDDVGKERCVGVFHASARIGDSSEVSHGLRLEDGGTSVLTWGDGRTGHLGHGAPAFEPKPKVVTTAVVLGSAASGVRSASVNVSVGDSLGGSSREVGGSSGGGSGGGEAGFRGVLALVDAAADRRDAADGRAVATEEEGEEEEEEEEGGEAKRRKVSQTDGR